MKLERLKNKSVCGATVKFYLHSVHARRANTMLHYHKHYRMLRNIRILIIPNVEVKYVKR